MAKITVEREGLRLIAEQVSAKGIAQIVDIIFRESQSDEDVRALKIREEFRAGKSDKIQAIIAIRRLFENTNDARKGLKEAKDFIEGAN